MSDASPAGHGETGSRKRLQDQAGELSPFLYGWAHLRLRRFPSSRLSAEDVVQETWMRALVAASSEERVPAAEALRPWLVGIARNVILEEVRRAGAREAQSERSSVLDAGVRDTVTSLCTQLARHELVQRFLAFADGLEEVDRQLLVRCGFEGGHPGEVALPLGLEPDSAARRWHRLRERLREARWDERWGLGS